MANKTIGQIASAASVAITDLIEIEQSGVSKQATLDQVISALAIPRGHIDGLILSNAADADHDITISAGQAVDSTNAMIFTLASAITKQIDATWASGTNAGGMDTGTVGTALTYYVWLIKKDSDASIDALFSLSATAPTMPAGYTYKRRIGTVWTDAASKIIGFTQTQDTFTFNQPIQSRAIAAVANTNKNGYVVSVPPLMTGIFTLSFITDSNNIFLWYGNSSRPDTAASSSNYDIWINNLGGNISVEAQIKTDSSKQIFAKANSTGFRLGIFSLGWIDDRGRNA